MQGPQILFQELQFWFLIFLKLYFLIFHLPINNIKSAMDNKLNASALSFSLNAYLLRPSILSSPLRATTNFSQVFLHVLNI